jgi:hypothetical protein
MKMAKKEEKENWVIPDFDNYEINKVDDKFLIKKTNPRNYVVACTIVNIALLALNVCVFLSTKILVTTIIQVVK